jgi:hypothetical protein
MPESNGKVLPSHWLAARLGTTADSSSKTISGRVRYRTPWCDPRTAFETGPGPLRVTLPKSTTGGKRP